MAGRFMTKIYCKQARVFARTVKFSGSPGARRTTPALQGDACPDRFDKAERPRSLSKSINRSQDAGDRKSQNEPGAPPLECVTHQHGCHGKKSEQGKACHAARIFARVEAGKVSQAVRNTSLGAVEEIVNR